MKEMGAILDIAPDGRLPQVPSHGKLHIRTTAELIQFAINHISFEADGLPDGGTCTSGTRVELRFCGRQGGCQSPFSASGSGRRIVTPMKRPAGAGANSMRADRRAARSK